MGASQQSCLEKNEPLSGTTQLSLRSEDLLGLTCAIGPAGRPLVLSTTAARQVSEHFTIGKMPKS